MTFFGGVHGTQSNDYLDATAGCRGCGAVSGVHGGVCGGGSGGFRHGGLVSRCAAWFRFVDETVGLNLERYL